MGSVASKARKLPSAPTKAKPAWAGARTGEAAAPPSPPPTASLRASGSRTAAQAIDADSKDPQLLDNLRRMGQVTIASRSTAGTSERVARSLQRQVQSEEDALRTRPPRNKLHAPALAALFDELREAATREEEEAVAARYGVDAELMRRLSRVLNSPSVGETVKVVVDGEQRLNMSAEWVSKSKIASAPTIASR